MDEWTNVSSKPQASCHGSSGQVLQTKGRFYNSQILVRWNTRLYAFHTSEPMLKRVIPVLALVALCWIVFLLDHSIFSDRLIQYGYQQEGTSQR